MLRPSEGLRDPRRAVARNVHLRGVGNRIRQCFEDLLTSQVLTEFENAHDDCPFAEDLIWKGPRDRLRHEFEAELVQEGYQSGLLRELLCQADDPDATVLPDWIEHGFPIGINREIECAGIFPRTR